MIDIIAMPPVMAGQPASGRDQDTGGENGQGGFARLLAELGAIRPQVDVEMKDNNLRKGSPLEEEEPDKETETPLEAQGLSAEAALYQGIPLATGTAPQGPLPKALSEPAGLDHGYHLSNDFLPVNEMPDRETAGGGGENEITFHVPKQTGPDAAQAEPETTKEGLGAAQAGPGAAQAVMPRREVLRAATAAEEDNALPAGRPQPPLPFTAAGLQAKTKWAMAPQAIPAFEGRPEETGDGNTAAQLAGMVGSTGREETDAPSPLFTGQPLDTQRTDFPERLAETVAKHTGDGCSEFDITLYPKQLGRVTVNVRLEQGSAVLSFLCETAEAQQVLNAHAADIGSLVQQHIGQEAVIEVPHTQNQSQNPGDFEGRGEKRQGRQQPQHRKQSLDLFIDQLKSAQITA